MSPQTEAVWFNALPLLILAVAYLLVAVALVPTLWRERSRVAASDLAIALVFVSVGIPAAILGAALLRDRAPVGGHVWPLFAATVIAIAPAVLFLTRWRDRSEIVISGARAREAEELVSLRDRELDTVALLATSLARTHEPAEAGRALLDEVAALLNVDFAALALIDEDAREAHGLVARAGGEDLSWWGDVRVDLRNEPSGIASAYFDGAPVAVYDVEASQLVSRKLAEAVGAKSAAFVPLPVDERTLFLCGVVKMYNENYREADHYFTQIYARHPESTLAPKALTPRWEGPRGVVPARAGACAGQYRRG